MRFRCASLSASPLQRSTSRKFKRGMLLKRPSRTAACCARWGVQTPPEVDRTVERFQGQEKAVMIATFGLGERRSDRGRGRIPLQLESVQRHRVARQGETDRLDEPPSDRSPAAGAKGAGRIPAAETLRRWLLAPIRGNLAAGISRPLRDQVPMKRGLPLRSLLDDGDLPVAAIARIAKREGMRPRPVYQAHKWFARRFATTARSLLAAAGAAPGGDFWKAYYGDADCAGLTVLDPFMGGGVMLLEAARLGADIRGVDVEPVACVVADLECSTIPSTAYDRTGATQGPRPGRLPADSVGCFLDLEHENARPYSPIEFFDRGVPGPALGPSRPRRRARRPEGDGPGAWRRSTSRRTKPAPRAGFSMRSGCRRSNAPNALAVSTRIRPFASPGTKRAIASGSPARIAAAFSKASCPPNPSSAPAGNEPSPLRAIGITARPSARSADIPSG